MEENLVLETQSQVLEPASVDNSEFDIANQTLPEVNQVQDEGESIIQDPSEELILGKFKSVDDLSKAYEELQRYQGHCSEELGALRKELSSVKSMQELMHQYETLQNGYLNVINRDKAKYNSPEYFSDPTFREIYKEALYLYGENLDTDRLVTLLDAYANARIFANDKKKAAQKENEELISNMSYSENPKSTFTPPKKRFDEMTEKEIDELLDKLI